MNTHDKDELPTLPSTWYNESTKDTMREYTHGTIEHFLNQSGQYVTNDASRQADINVAIEPYAKRIAELEAARIAYASEFAPNEDGEPDVGRIHENIRKLKADRQSRGEPVAWLVTGPYEKVAFADKSAAESYCKGLNSGFGSSAYSTSPLYLAPQPAEPVKVPSDAQPLLDMIDILCTGLEWNIENHPEVMNEADGEALAEARALLARYGPHGPNGERQCRYCDETDTSGQGEKFSSIGASVDFARDKAILGFTANPHIRLTRIGVKDVVLRITFR